MKSYDDKIFIKRCFDLALLGKGQVSPNPIVGAVVVYKNRIIGEGFHKAYGQAHAEVNAIKSIKKADLKFLKSSTIYISLEPCCIHLNTPPCTNLIIENEIPRVVFASIDKTPEVSGKSIEILKSAGCEVRFGILDTEGDDLTKYRNAFVGNKRPYVILKWAQSKDGFMGRKDKPLWLTNRFSKILVHKWRSETSAILIGTNTAKTDNPKLTNRLYFGNSPLRIVLDKNLRLKDKLHLYDDSTPTWVVTEKEVEKNSFQRVQFKKIEFDNHLIINILRKLYQAKCNSLIVEGGARLLNSFLQSGLWDEARIFIADRYIQEGISAPVLPVGPQDHFKIDQDTLLLYKNGD